MRAALKLVLLGTAITLAGCGEDRTQRTFGAVTVDPIQIDFGEVVRGGSASAKLTLHNQGRASVLVRQASMMLATEELFSVTLAAPATIESGGDLPFTVVFTPGTGRLGAHNAVLQLQLEGGDAQAIEVPLTARLIENPLPPPDDLYWIAFDTNRGSGNRDIFAVRPDGTDVRKLAATEWTEIDPAFSPDGLRLAFASDRVDFTLQIFVMDLATSAVTQVTKGTVGARQPAWSPDGTRLAFHRGLGVYTIGVDGLDERHIIDGLNAFNSYQFASYLPGGNWLVMSRTNQIDAIRTDGTGLRQIVENTTTQIRSPSASPSGATIAFAAFCGGKFSVRSAPTSALTSACAGASEVHFPGRKPAWGPGLIAFETDEANADIHIIDPTGGTPVPVTQDPADERNPAWSPKGTLLP